MAIVWPASLPQAPRLGWKEVAGSNVIRTKVASGPAKLRRRFTFAVPKLTWPTTPFTDTQLATFWTFFRTTIKDGSLKFQIPHPRDGATVEARFRTEPEFEQISADFHRAVLEFEVIEGLDL